MPEVKISVDASYPVSTVGKWKIILCFSAMKDDF